MNNRLHSTSLGFLAALAIISLSSGCMSEIDSEDPAFDADMAALTVAPADGICSVAESLEVTDITESSAHFAWDGDLDAWFYLLYYRIAGSEYAGWYRARVFDNAFQREGLRTSADMMI